MGYRCVLTILALLLVAPPTHAQQDTVDSSIRAAFQRPGAMTPAARETLYRQLEQQAAVLEAQANVVKTVARLIGPATVHIEANIVTGQSLQYGRGQYREEAGSGVIISLDDSLFVLTNRHVIDGAKLDGIRIHLADGRTIHPTNVEADPDTDVAIMTVDEPNLEYARIGDSDKLVIGDFVLAVGSPFGLSHSVTYGIISAKGRRGLDLGTTDVKFQDFLQTDAAINPGNSGGPLVNLRGEVVGIITAIASNSGGNEGIGFAIPINMFMVVARQLASDGRVRRAFLGVSLDPDFKASSALSLGLSRPIGTRVTGITLDSPAADAGLESDDVILQVEGVPIDDDDHLVNIIKLTDIGRSLTLTILRSGQTQKISVTVADWSDYAH